MSQMVFSFMEEQEEAMTKLIFLALLFGQHPQEEVYGPDKIARIALFDLNSFSPQATGLIQFKDPRPYIRYLSLYHLPEKDAVEWRKSFTSSITWLRFLGFWANTMSVEQALGRLVPVPGTNNRLLRINDIRDFGWSAKSWRSVANREPFFREPWINSVVAKLLRDSINETPDVTTFHIYAVIRGDWFFRETAETDRSPSYYDLLYTRHRFPDGVVLKDDVVKVDVAQKKIKIAETVPWKGGIWPDDGKFYPAGAFTHKTGKEIEIEDPAAKIVVPTGTLKAIDFPKDKKEWDKAWGLDVQNDFLKKAKFQAINGQVALGMGDDPKKGSWVARNNRLLTFQNSPVCVAGASLESYDVLDPVGERDYVQNAPNLAKGKIVFDAQELLINLPNGLQAALLVAGKDGNRVEVADNKVAVDTIREFEKKIVVPGYQVKIDARVRTPGSCYVCHAVNNGIIDPGRLVKDFFGGDFQNPLFIVDPDLRRQFKGFYLDWEEKIEVLQTPMKIAVKKSTEYDKEKPWNGLDVAKLVFAFRDLYDRPLDLDQVCSETGIAKEDFARVTVKSASVWVALLRKGQPIPRRTFDVDVFPDIMKNAVLAGYIPPFEEKKGR